MSKPVFDWCAYWERIDAAIASNAKLKSSPNRRPINIAETVKSCAPLTRPVRKSAPRSNRNAS